MKTKNRLWSLYLALLNVNYGWSAGKFYYIKKRQRIWEPIVIVVSIAPLLFLGVWFVWTLTEKLFLAGLTFGQPHLPLVNGTLMVSVLGLFFGFFYVLSAFYFSNDLHNLYKALNGHAIRNGKAIIDDKTRLDHTIEGEGDHKNHRNPQKLADRILQDLQIGDDAEHDDAWNYHGKGVKHSLFKDEFIPLIGRLAHQTVQPA